MNEFASRNLLIIAPPSLKRRLLEYQNHTNKHYFAKKAVVMIPFRWVFLDSNLKNDRNS